MKKTKEICCIVVVGVLLLIQSRQESTVTVDGAEFAMKGGNRRQSKIRLRELPPNFGCVQRVFRAKLPTKNRAMLTARVHIRHVQESYSSQ